MCSARLASECFDSVLKLQKHVSRLLCLGELLVAILATMVVLAG